MSDKLRKLQRLYTAQTAQAFMRRNPNMDIYPIMNPGASYVDGSADELGEYLAGGLNKEYVQKAPHGDWLADTGDFQNEFITGGFFADCGLEAGIVNLTIQPQHTLFNLLPIRSTIQDTVKLGYLSAIGGYTGDRPTTKCAPGQYMGDDSYCSMEMPFGRQIYSSRTLEMDELIRKAKAASWQNFYLIGSVRGVSAMPSMEALADTSWITNAHVRKQMAMVGKLHQNYLMYQLYSGTPGNPADTNGFYDFFGLDNLVIDNYEAQNFVSGDDCAELNSVVVDFDAEICGATSIYDVMREMEDAIYNRALLQGHDGEWVWVMHPVHWSELTRCIACEMISDNCNSEAVSDNFTVTVNDMSATQMIQAMRSTMRIDLNGRSYPVVLDHAIPVTDIGVNQYSGSIYFLPLRVNGENVLEVWHRDYSQLAPQFQGLPGNGMRHIADSVWSDQGRFLWGFDIGQTAYCFGMTAKTEVALVLSAPQLAGKITNVSTQALDVPRDIPTLP